MRHHRRNARTLLLCIIVVMPSFASDARADRVSDETTEKQSLAPWQEEANRKVRVLTAPHQENICEKDQKPPTQADPASDRERATCLIRIKWANSKDEYRASGFIVSSHMVVTAGHCVLDRKLGWATAIQVVPGCSGTDGGIPVGKWGSYDGQMCFTVSGWGTKGSIDYDYGGIYVAKDLMQKVKAKINIDPSDDPVLKKMDMSISGYPDAEPAQWKTPTKNIETVESLKLSHRINTAGGFSGSPFFEDGANAPHAVGIHANGGQTGNCPNWATRIDSFRQKKILDDWHP